MEAVATWSISIVKGSFEGSLKSGITGENRTAIGDIVSHQGPSLRGHTYVRGISAAYVHDVSRCHDPWLVWSRDQSTLSDIALLLLTMADRRLWRRAVGAVMGSSCCGLRTTMYRFLPWGDVLEWDCIGYILRVFSILDYGISIFSVKSPTFYARVWARLSYGSATEHGSGTCLPGVFVSRSADTTHSYNPPYWYWQCRSYRYANNESMLPQVGFYSI